MKHLIFIDWISGHVEDTDEYIIEAENERDAMLFAVAEWWHETQARGQRCRITSVSFADFAEMGDAGISPPAALSVCAAKSGFAGRPKKTTFLRVTGVVDRAGKITKFEGKP